MKQETNEQKIARKLIVEGLYPISYSQEVAIQILKPCVAGAGLIRILQKNEAEIISEMKKIVSSQAEVFDFWKENKCDQLQVFRKEFKETGVVNPGWNFHPAYVYGNDRVSCMICVLASQNDICNGAKHNPWLFKEMSSMEKESGFTMRKDFALHELKIK